MGLIHVIGAGPGDERLLTADARAAIAGADLVFAADRHAGLRADVRPLALDEIGAAHLGGQDVAVIVSGDASLYSLLHLIVGRLGADAVTVHPGIGAIQALCAALKTDWNGAKIISAHGREMSVSALGHCARTSAKLIVFLDAERDAKWAANALVAEGLGGCAMSVGERLSYPKQKITRGAASELTGIEADPLSVLMIENQAPVCDPPEIGLPDEAFIRGVAPMTKREIRTLVISELQLKIDRKSVV